jgi:hypothetical protein
MLLLTMAMFLVGLFLGSVALAQGTTMIDGGFDVAITTNHDGIPLTTAPLAPSGGPSLLLPGAALLLGTGVLTYSVLRRGR